MKILLIAINKNYLSDAKSLIQQIEAVQKNKNQKKFIFSATDPFIQLFKSETETLKAKTEYESKCGNLSADNHLTASYICADEKILTSLNNFLSTHPFTCIDNQTYLPITKKQKLNFQFIAKSEFNRILVVRAPSYYSVDTADNPYMIESIEAWTKEGINQANLAFESKKQQRNCPQKEIFIEEFTTQYIKDKKKSLMLKAIAEHENLVKAYQKYDIPCYTLLPEKGKLKNGDFAHKTDEVFATDTGEYFIDKTNKLHFIAGKFANEQRFNEERLAISQAASIFNATTHRVRHPKTGELLKFEGGDIRRAPGRQLFFIGFGHRNDQNVAQAVKNISDSTYTVVPVELLQSKYYHLDCCFVPLFDDHALLYEGEYQIENGKILMEKSNPFDAASPEWPLLIPETATMSVESRRMIRELYDNQHLILITEKEAAAFGANAVTVKVGDAENEKNALFFPTNALTPQTIALIKEKFPDDIIEEITFDTMHYSGGSLHCATQEIPCSIEFVKQLKQKKEPAADEPIRKFTFFDKNKSDIHTITETPSVFKKHKNP